jgi:hypothetical protein
MNCMPSCLYISCMYFMHTARCHEYKACSICCQAVGMNCMASCLRISLHEFHAHSSDTSIKSALRCQAVGMNCMASCLCISCMNFMHTAVTRVEAANSALTYEVCEEGLVLLSHAGGHIYSTTYRIKLPALSQSTGILLLFLYIQSQQVIYAYGRCI